MVACCIERGFHHLYLRRIESATQEVYRENRTMKAAHADTRTPAMVQRNSLCQQRSNVFYTNSPDAD
jgi:hypothetical protein